MIDKVKKTFFVLLEAGLWNKHPMSDLDFDLTQAQWRELFTIAMNHTVDGIVYDGLLFLPESQLPDKSLLLEWTVRVDRIERRNIWMNKLISHQLKNFEKYQLTPFLLKGQGLAQCYENPSHRICGDVDWYFYDRQMYNLVNDKLRNAGVKITNSPGYSISYVWNNCEIEHHRRIFDIHNPFKQRYLKNLESAEFPHRIEFQIDEMTALLPSPILTHVQVNAHILKHLLSFGIGLRQLCDSARVCYTYHDSVDGTRLEKIYKDLGIYKWIQLLHQLLHQFLGLPRVYLPFPLSEDLNADWMMEEIWQAGNFGFHDLRVDLEKEKTQQQRVDSLGRLTSNFTKYVPFAPMEAIFFPVMQFYSRFVH